MSDLPPIDISAIPESQHEAVLAVLCDNKSLKQGDARQIAHLFFDLWFTTFQELIRAPDMAIETHSDQLRARFAPSAE